MVETAHIHRCILGPVYTLLEPGAGALIWPSVSLQSSNIPQQHPQQHHSVGRRRGGRMLLLLWGGLGQGLQHRRVWTTFTYRIICSILLLKDKPRHVYLNDVLYILS